ncbi:hypothetical protein Bbelb_098930 [Branchiostoma belcheri]|nr:hypothetical protein Bbelb_098930 [Branchiostoma belcheri]
MGGFGRRFFSVDLATRKPVRAAKRNGGLDRRIRRDQIKQGNVRYEPLNIPALRLAAPWWPQPICRQSFRPGIAAAAVKVAINQRGEQSARTGDINPPAGERAGGPAPREDPDPAAARAAMTDRPDYRIVPKPARANGMFGGRGQAGVRAALSGADSCNESHHGGKVSAEEGITVSSLNQWSELNRATLPREEYRLTFHTERQSRCPGHSNAVCWFISPRISPGHSNAVCRFISPRISQGARATLMPSVGSYHPVSVKSRCPGHSNAVCWFISPRISQGARATLMPSVGSYHRPYQSRCPGHSNAVCWFISARISPGHSNAVCWFISPPVSVKRTALARVASRAAEPIPRFAHACGRQVRSSPPVTADVEWRQENGMNFRWCVMWQSRLGFATGAVKLSIFRHRRPKLARSTLRRAGDILGGNLQIPLLSERTGGDHQTCPANGSAPRHRYVTHLGDNLDRICRSILAFLLLPCVLPSRGYLSGWRRRALLKPAGLEQPCPAAHKNARWDLWNRKRGSASVGLQTASPSSGGRADSAAESVAGSVDESEKACGSDGRAGLGGSPDTPPVRLGLPGLPAPTSYGKWQGAHSIALTAILQLEKHHPPE